MVLNRRRKSRSGRLKDNETNRYFVMARIIRYSYILNIEPPSLVVFNRREVLALPMVITRGRRVSARKYGGVCYTYWRVVFIHICFYHTLEALEETIVHELCHLRFPRRSHGKRFRKVVRRALEYAVDGKRFLPYRGSYRFQDKEIINEVVPSHPICGKKL